MRTLFFALLLPALVVTSAPAQKPDEPKPGDVMIDKYLAAETARISTRFLDGAKTLDEWQSRRPRLHREYLDMLGLWPLPERTPLFTTITGTRERDGVVIEKLHFQSRPGLYVTGNLYRPKASRERQRPEKRLPAVLYVCGHSGRGRDGNKTAFQDHGMWFATNGYICLIIDTLQLGEIPGIHHGTYSHGRWWWQARGYTPAGVECWNGIRAIDYLVGRPDVDSERIAVTGISGGGAATVWISAADERVKCAVPVSGMSDLESYVTHKVINGHCDCMFLINTYQWEWTTIAALIAPRPLLFANSDNDRIFPMDGNRRIAARLRKLYGMYSKPKLFDDYISKGGHDYRPDLRIAVFKWINRHMKGVTGEVKDADFKPLPGNELRVFPQDKDVPKDAINGKIDESFVPRALVRLPEAGKFEEWKQALAERLSEKSFRGFMKRIPEVQLGEVVGSGLKRIDGVNNTNVSLYDDNMFLISEMSFCATAKVNPRSETLVLLDSVDERYMQPPRWAEPYAGNWKVARTPMVNLRGNPYHPWTTKSPPNYVERAHALIGQTVDEGRVGDLLGTIRHLNERGERKRWRIVGKGQGGILAAYAALLEPSITEVVIIDPPASHRDGPIFLNVLRVLDIPEALGLLAPRRLTLVNAKDRAFDRTAAIYKLAGAEDKFQRK
jgi:cephalosporin-C deacetylase-like acetyl esterase